MVYFRWSQPTTAEITTKEKATKTFASLRAMIDECEKILQEKLEIIENKNKEFIKEYPEQLEQQQKQIHKQKDDFKRMLSYDNHQMKLKSKSNLNKNLNEIFKQLMEGPIKIHYHIEGLNKLQATIGDSLKRILTIDKRESN